MDEQQQLNELARLMELVLAGRPDRVTQALLATLSSADAQTYAAVESALAEHAQSEVAAIQPDAAAKDRLLAAFAQKQLPARRAVLVLDMIVDHLLPGRPLEVPRARAIVPALVESLTLFRRDAVPVVYVLDHHQPGDPDLESWGQHAVAGTEGAEIWPALAPHPGDLLVHKPTYSAFLGTNLQEVLDDVRCDTLVLTGCLTEIGLMATAMDALQRGYALEIPRETQAGFSLLNEHMALGVLSVMAPYAPARQNLLQKVATKTP